MSITVLLLGYRRLPASLTLMLLSSQLWAIDPCRINIIEESSGWPVPLVELTTTHHVRFVSDNAGVIAFDLPELMGKETWFSVRGHGYVVPKDRFGYRGVRLVPRAGETITVKVKRQLPGKRIGRITGGGLFGESQKLGLHLDWQEQGILGCDSVQTAAHKQRLFWAWGDTVLARYPLGRFHMIGGWTDLQPPQRWRPPIKLRYHYVKDENGIPRDTARMPGRGPTWLNGYVSLPNQSGESLLVATYSKINPPLEVYEVGLCVWNDEREVFERSRMLWQRSDKNPDPPAVPHGHPVFWEDDSGKAWVLFGDPFPTLKCEATYQAWADPGAWQILEPQLSVPTGDGKLQIKPHRGAIAWSSYRKKWVAIFTQQYGQSSLLGEIWYAESDDPTGPWENAIQVVTHEDYTFYNPQLHSRFTPPDSPILLFEGTFTKTFSGTTESTPRHDYNQVLYRLDLDELND